MLLEHLVFFQSNITENNFFVIQWWGFTKKIRLPPMKIAKIFMSFNFLSKISQNHIKSGKKTRDFFQKLEQKTNKSIEMDGIFEKSMIENGGVRRSPARVASKTVSFPSSKTSTCRKNLRKSSQNRFKNWIFYQFTIVILISLNDHALPNLSRAKKSGSHTRQVAPRIPANLEIWKKNL